MRTAIRIVSACLVLVMGLAPVRGQEPPPAEPAAPAPPEADDDERLTLPRAMAAVIFPAHLFEDADVTPEPGVPDTHWNHGQPLDIRSVRFASDAEGTPLPPSNRRPDLGPVYVWEGQPLWLIVELGPDADAGAICAQWIDPGGRPAREECKAMAPSTRLAFEAPDTRGWPERRHQVRLYQPAELGCAGCGPMPRPREVAQIDYAIGDRGPTAAIRPPDDELPEFPWPPPHPTSRAVLDRARLLGPATTLGEVAVRLQEALRQAGYLERSFYAVPGGFALATRLEQIEFDGTPKPQNTRWSSAFPPRRLFSLADYLSALLQAPEGNYRVIVFVINDRPFPTTATPIDQATAQAWVGGGLNRLPEGVARVPLSAAHGGEALVYQFRKVGHRDAEPNPDGAAAAEQQLERSRILAGLRP